MNTDSFSYRGYDLSKSGINYVPDSKGLHIWQSNFKAVEKKSDVLDGGNWCGTTVNQKEFEIKCYFEEITQYQLEIALSFFKKGAVGDLIFGERQWLKYTGRVAKPYITEKYSAPNGRLSGLVTFYITAYDPFAVSIYKTLDEVENGLAEYIGEAQDHTGLLYEKDMPVNVTTLPITAQRTYIAYNGGNVEADTVIKIAGDVGTGVTIYNQATKQTCKVMGLTATATTNLGRWLELNSKTGECILTDGSNVFNGYRYHDNGFINLVPSCPIYRDVVMVQGESSIMTEEDIFYGDMTDQYILIDGTYEKITTVISSKEITIANVRAGVTDFSTPIVHINPILITPLSTMSLTKLDINSEHTFE